MLPYLLYYFFAKSLFTSTQNHVKLCLILCRHTNLPHSLTQFTQRLKALLLKCFLNCLFPLHFSDYYTLNKARTRTNGLHTWSKQHSGIYFFRLSQPIKGFSAIPPPVCRQLLENLQYITMERVAWLLFQRVSPMAWLVLYW